VPSSEQSASRIRLLKPTALPGVTLFSADRFRHRFGRHTHEEYALGVITHGVLGFDYRGASHLAGYGEINLVVPDEAHTGQPALGEYWSYRMFYIEPAVMQSIASEIGRRAGSLPFFAAGVLRDRELAVRILRLHDDLFAGRTSTLEGESRLVALLADWLLRHAEPRVVAQDSATHSRQVERVRERIEDTWQDKPTLPALAAETQLSPYQLLRAFRQRFGIPPHGYLIQKQVQAAKRLLDRGASIAAAAAAAGFADQSHLNRHFKRTLGITPGHYCNFVQEHGRSAR
jgi:AraC-like DNA-binding protein